MAWILAVLGALLFGRICIRWHDCGIACVSSASAGCLTGFGLSVLRTPSPMLAAGFLTCFAALLLLDSDSERPPGWLDEWRLTLHRLMPFAVFTAFLAGLSNLPLLLIPLACVLAALSQLSWHPWPDTVRLGLILTASAALGILFAPLSALWTDLFRGVLCASCLYVSGYRCLPLGHRLYPNKHILAVFFLFVFLICYYTNCNITT